MTEQHARFADWDGAYVLGALSAEDRRAFEMHMGACAACRRAVAELAGLPGLLARVDPQVALGLDDDTVAFHRAGPGAAFAGADHETAAAAAAAAAGVPAAGAAGAATAGAAAAAGGGTDAGTGAHAADPAAGHGERAASSGSAGVSDSVVGLRPGGQQRRRARRRSWIVGVAAAACAAAIAVAVVQPWDRPPPEPPAVTMTAIGGTPLTAQVRLTDKAWGTSIAMTCSYPTEADQQPGRDYVYAMEVIDSAGRRSQISTWRAGPGDTSRLTGATALTHQQIRAVSVHNVDTGTEVLTATLPG
ncbi:zf-HC2 domain-containing protein [Nakamurella aerolata]|uniref:zf-HC2 domain-containing protein n=1 Tax=Nakamurella aerolata TaxID=1656892 RepID=UPI001BB151E1|nr:zf-HC2 domain-containing protein [Nakamurella aerolata]